MEQSLIMGGGGRGRVKYLQRGLKNFEPPSNFRWYENW